MKCNLKMLMVDGRRLFATMNDRRARGEKCDRERVGRTRVGKSERKRETAFSFVRLANLNFFRESFCAPSQFWRGKLLLAGKVKGNGSETFPIPFPAPCMLFDFLSFAVYHTHTKERHRVRV